jgi:hypothetical protein
MQSATRLIEDRRRKIGGRRWRPRNRIRFLLAGIGGKITV